MSAVTSTFVDLSRIDPGLVVHIASFLGLSRELLNLALVCRSFGRREPPSRPSLVDEAARQFLVNQLRPNDVERDMLPQHDDGARATTSWLTNLHELERLRLPLKFSILGLNIQHPKSTVKRFSSDGCCITAMTNCVMRRGVHYASFEPFEGGSDVVGVARPLRILDFASNEPGGLDMFNEPLFENLLARRTDGWVGNVHCCGISCFHNIISYSTDWLENDTIHWEVDDAFCVGDTAGLLVDLNEGTLAVYKNGRRLGVAKDGLAGEYCFFVTLWSEGEISVERGLPPRDA